jgi:hypothetical protein
MILSSAKISNIKKAEQRTFKFYYDNTFNSYKSPNFEYEYEENEISSPWFCLLHLVDPICHLMKLLINLSRFLVSLFDLAVCYLSGEEKSAKKSALNNTKNTFLLFFINIGNILISVIAFLPRLFITFRDVLCESEEFINDKGYQKENIFFKNILDVFGNNIPGSPKKSQVNPQDGFFETRIGMAKSCVNKLANAIESQTYDPGF